MATATKTSLYVRLEALRLLHFGQVVQNRRGTLSLVWHEWLSCKGKELKAFCCGVALSSEPQVRTFQVHLADHFNKLHQKACRTSCTIIFLNSTNQIIVLWCCRSHKTMIWLVELRKIIKSLKSLFCGVVEAVSSSFLKLPNEKKRRREDTSWQFISSTRI